MGNEKRRVKKEPLQCFEAGAMALHVVYSVGGEVDGRPGRQMISLRHCFHTDFVDS